MHAPQHSNPPYSPVGQNPYAQPDYPRGPAGQGTAQQSSGVLYNNSQPPINPVFGLTLEDLFRRDGSPVPMVVYQCIQAVDLFGLEVEGIYRIPGTSSHIQQMKALFDSGTCWPSPSNRRRDADYVQMLRKWTLGTRRPSNMTSIVLPAC